MSSLPIIFFLRQFHFDIHAQTTLKKFIPFYYDDTLPALRLVFLAHAHYVSTLSGNFSSSMVSVACMIFSFFSNLWKRIIVVSRILLPSSHFLGKGTKEAFEALSSAQALDVGQVVWSICKLYR